MEHRARVFCRSLGAIAATVTFLTSCAQLTESTPSSSRFAAVNIVAKATGSGRAMANATVIFFDAISAAVPNSALQQTDQCTFANVDTTTVVTRGVKKAGTSVGLLVGTTALTLPYDAGLFRYANPVNTPFSYATGDVAQATLPDGGEVFPASAISVRLAEPLLPGPLVLPVSGQALVVTWNAVSDTSSAIILQLKYANPTTSTYANEQVICSLKDDGRYDVPAGGLTAFLASPANRRSLQLTRWRTKESSIDSKTLLHIATSVDTVIVFP